MTCRSAKRAPVERRPFSTSELKTEVQCEATSAKGSLSRSGGGRDEDEESRISEFLSICDEAGGGGVDEAVDITASILVSFFSISKASKPTLFELPVVDITKIRKSIYDTEIHTPVRRNLCNSRP
jgi:hypothetical protein